MELESLKHQIAFLEGKKNILINKPVTVRHSQVTSYLAEEMPHIQHAFDVWHIAKGDAVLID